MVLRGHIKQTCLFMLNLDPNIYFDFRRECLLEFLVFVRGGAEREGRGSNTKIHHDITFFAHSNFAVFDSKYVVKHAEILIEFFFLDFVSKWRIYLGSYITNFG